MKRKRLIIPMVAFAIMALMLSATGASANPHETVGELRGDCVVDGRVSLSSNNAGETGLDSNPGSNHYVFEQTTLTCESQLDAKVDGVYDVTAEGDTASYTHQLDKGATLPTDAGEDCDQGGSIKVDEDGDGVLDEVHSGTLDADTTSPGSNSLDGKVHFVRLGTTVLADGPLWEDGTGNPAPADPKYWFQAELEFIPDQDCATTPVTGADLIGTGEIYAGNSIHDCGLDNDKVDDKDC